MKIAVLDDSKTYLKYLKKQLEKLGYHNIFTFEEEHKFFEFAKNTPDLDIIFIDYHLKNMDGFDVVEKCHTLLPDSYKIMITSDSDPTLKEKALEKGFDNFISKDISFVDFQALMNMTDTLRRYIRKEIEKKESFKRILKYKEYQEKIIHQKQNKIMKNELEMYFDENYVFETYFQPKDTLTGDTVHSKKISDSQYFIGIIDAMGKGLGASLTSFNVLAFLKHSINKAIEYNDFNFEKLVKDFVNYVKTIILENEILCATLIFIDNTDVYFANFGNPPILKDNTYIKANNFPITISTSDFSIDSFSLNNKMLISTDGIFESPYENTLYYKRLKEIFPKITFLREIIDDFKQNSTQTDDICMILINKEEKNFTEIFDKEIKLNKQSIDLFLSELYNTDIPAKEQIHYILHEILINTYEHSILKIENKENFKKEKNFLQEYNENSTFFAKIKLSKNEQWVKLEYNDNTVGFEVQKIKDAYYKKYHGRGIKIIKHLSYGLFFNHKGTAIKIFLKA